MAARAGELPLTGAASLIVLAGGRSARMGRPKHALPVADTTLLEWIVARLGPAFAETLVCGSAEARGARAVTDRVADGGPLAGIEAGLTAMREERAFVLACDTPRASGALATLLLQRVAGHDAAVPRLGTLDQPTCAAYARSARDRIAAYLDGGSRRVSGALATLDVVRIEESELIANGIGVDELADIDTPADYEAFVASLRA